jgi:uncharacterized protein
MVTVVHETAKTRGVISLLQSALIIFGMLYVTVLAGMYFMQRNIQYLPSGSAILPSEAGLPGTQSVFVQTSDGEKIQAWYHKAQPDKPTILYFHGNGGGISTRPNKQAFFAKLGFGLLAVSYRGYQGSTGSPTEQGLHLDAEAAYLWLLESGVAPADIVVLGESLGTGVAVQLAARHQVKAIALEAPYANAVDVGADRYWFLPVRWLMKDQFRSADHIDKVNAPLLVLHGTADKTIPFSQGEKLFKLANQPKQMVVMIDVGHEIISDPRSWGKIAAFFDSAH